MKAEEIALAGPHTCYWGGSQRGAHALAGLWVPGGPLERAHTEASERHHLLDWKFSVSCG